MLDETEDGRVLEHFFEQGERVPESEWVDETVLKKEALTGSIDLISKEGKLSDILKEKELTETADKIPECGRSIATIRTISRRDVGRDGETGAEKASNEPDKLNELNELDEKDVKKSGEAEKAEEPETSGTWDSQEAEYEIIPSSEATNYQRFESMLRSLVSEAVAEQNEKLEQALAELIRDEIEDLYIQLCQDEGQREVAAADEQNQERQAPDQRISSGRIRELLKRTLKNLFHV